MIRQSVSCVMKSAASKAMGAVMLSGMVMLGVGVIIIVAL